MCEVAANKKTVLIGIDSQFLVHAAVGSYRPGNDCIVDAPLSIRIVAPYGTARRNKCVGDEQVKTQHGAAGLWETALSTRSAPRIDFATTFVRQHGHTRRSRK
jgi:hypothetical protein